MICGHNGEMALTWRRDEENGPVRIFQACVACGAYLLEWVAPGIARLAEPLAGARVDRERTVNAPDAGSNPALPANPEEA